MGYQMVTWPMTSRDPQRCCEAVGSAILATAWLLVRYRALQIDTYLLTYFRDWIEASSVEYQQNLVMQFATYIALSQFVQWHCSCDSVRIRQVEWLSSVNSVHQLIAGGWIVCWRATVIQSQSIYSTAVSAPLTIYVMPVCGTARRCHCVPHERCFAYGLYTSSHLFNELFSLLSFYQTLVFGCECAQ